MGSVSLPLGRGAGDGRQQSRQDTQTARQTRTADDHSHTDEARHTERKQGTHRDPRQGCKYSTVNERKNGIQKNL